MMQWLLNEAFLAKLTIIKFFCVAVNTTYLYFMGYSHIGYSQFVYSNSFYLHLSKTDKKVIIVLIFTNESVRSS